MTVKVLWVTNAPVGEASGLFGLRPSVSGGWMSVALRLLSDSPEVRILVAFPSSRKADWGVYRQGSGATYVAFPEAKRVTDAQTESGLTRALARWRPDIMHVHGTEYSHSLVAVRLANRMDIPAVVSIQGLLGGIEQAYIKKLHPLAPRVPTMRDIVRRNSYRQQRASVSRGAVVESETIRSTANVIGRTDWDKAFVRQVNPLASYWHCDEPLRAPFFEGTWSIDSIDPGRIFVSQGYYPVKGLHLLLEALPLVMQRYPEAHVEVAGPSPLEPGWRGRARRTSYGKLLARQMERYRLEGRVMFLGVLGALQMRERMLGSHLHVIPSMLENSPNSLCEAMLLGVPSVAARVGGIPSLAQDRREAILYEGGSTEMLAQSILDVFGSDGLARGISIRARETARLRHDPDSFRGRMVEIYNDIAGV